MQQQLLRSFKASEHRAADQFHRSRHPAALKVTSMNLAHAGTDFWGGDATAFPSKTGLQADWRRPWSAWDRIRPWQASVRPVQLYKVTSCIETAVSQSECLVRPRSALGV